MKRFIVFVACLATLCGASANTSALNIATASTVEDNSYNFMNLLQWRHLAFENTFAFLTVGTDSTGNLAFARNTSNGNQLAFAWEGNLWNENQSQNHVSFFYGFGNMAFRGGITLTTDKNMFVADSDGKEFSPFLAFGINIAEKLGVQSGLSVDLALADTDTMNFLETNPGVSASIQYNVLSTEKLGGKVSAYYSGNFSNFKMSVDENNYSKSSHTVNSFGVEYRMQYKPVESLTYGLLVNIPFTIYGKTRSETALQGNVSSSSTSGTQTIAFHVNNGLEAFIIPNKFALNLGVATIIPSITFDSSASNKDEEIKFGTFSNTFYMGFSLMMTPQIRLDAATTIDYTPSLDDIWTTPFTLSISAKL